MKQRIQIRAAAAPDLDRIAEICADSPGPGHVRAHLSELLSQDCLLAAHYKGRIAGVVGVDPPGHTVAGPCLLPGEHSKDLQQSLLVAAERLAAQYGITRLTVHPQTGCAAFFEDKGYAKAAGNTEGASGEPGMTRSIVRRSTRFARAVRAVCSDLGISVDYGAQHRLRLQPEAQDLESIGEDIYGRAQKMAGPAARAWLKMQAAAGTEGVQIQTVSAFRTVDYQVGLIERKLGKGQQIDEILKVSAAPGFSEHHSGRAIDVTSPGSEVLEEPFENSDAFGWLCEHAAEFGFTLSYPRDNPHGVTYEPWHWAWEGGGTAVQNSP